ncbi:MAG: extracellular solute-binding protein [Clostridia bacterium]|nr:extracellular solute-binding protein [Clostridia bacterium]
MKTKKIIALLLSVAMTVPMLAACGDKENNLQIEPLDGFKEEGFPIVENGYELDVMLKYDSARSGNIEDNTAFKEMEKLTNVKLNLNAIDSTSFKEKLSVTLAGGELPDVFLSCGLGRSLIQQQTKMGTFIDLKPYIEEYAPNIKKLLDESAELRNIVTLPTGEIPALPFFQINLENKKCPPEMMMVYKPWLDKLGLEMPETTDDFYNVLKAFKEQDPNGNGKADEIPLCPRNLSHFYQMFAFFGIMANPTHNYMFLDGKEAQYAPLRPEFKEALAYFRKLYAEGLLDKDVFIQNQQQVLAKGTGADPVIGSTITSGGFVIVGNERNADMVPTPIISKPGAKEKMWISRELATPGAFAVSKACEHPEVAVRWIDYLYSDEGAKLAWMGVEGVSYEYADDGTWTWIKEGEESATEARARHTFNSGLNLGKFPVEWFDVNDGTETVANEQRVWMVENFGDCLRLPVPTVYLESADEKIISTTGTDLTQYVNQFIAQVVTGEIDLDASWADFEATCKRMGVDEMVQIYQSAFDKLS